MKKETNKKRNCDVSFISFTSTFKEFYKYNFHHTGKRPPQINYSNSLTETRAIYNLSTYFDPSTRFFFGCHEDHLCVKADTPPEFKTRCRVPCEVSWVDHPDLQARYVKEGGKSGGALVFENLPDSLKRAWSTFSGIVHLAIKQNRIFFAHEETLLRKWTDFYDSDIPKLPATLRKDTSYPGVEEILRKQAGHCTVLGDDLGFPSTGHRKGFLESAEHISERWSDKVSLRRTTFMRWCRAAAKEKYGVNWHKKLVAATVEELRIMNNEKAETGITA